MGIPPGGVPGNPPQYSCLENPIDGGAWWATVHGVAKSQTQLSNSLSLFFSDSVVQNPLAKAGDMGLILGLGRSPGEGNGNPLQYSCLGNPRDRGAWQATVHGVAKSQTQLKQLNMQTCVSLVNLPNNPNWNTLVHIGVCTKSLQLCLTLCNPMDYSPPGSSVHGIFQAKILGWVLEE